MNLDRQAPEEWMNKENPLWILCSVLFVGNMDL
jgi:hypothetical protein